MRFSKNSRAAGVSASLARPLAGEIADSMAAAIKCLCDSIIELPPNDRAVRSPPHAKTVPVYQGG
jgi:hypothetical protein